MFHKMLLVQLKVKQVLLKNGEMIFDLEKVIKPLKTSIGCRLVQLFKKISYCISSVETINKSAFLEVTREFCVQLKSTNR